MRITLQGDLVDVHPDDGLTWVSGVLYFREPLDRWAKDGEGLRRGAGPRGGDLLTLAKAAVLLKSVVLVRLVGDGTAIGRCVQMPATFVVVAPIVDCDGS